MIFVPSKKFLYLRVPKTGSTSVTNYLLDHVQQFDDLKCSTPDAPIKTIVNEKFIDARAPVHSRIYTLTELKYFSTEEYKALKVFAVVREPVDRTISLAYNVVSPKFTEGKSLDWVVENLLDNHIKYVDKQSEILLYNGSLLPNIYPYEKTSEMLQDIAVLLGFPYTPNSYKHRSEERKDRTKSLNKRLVDKIYDLYDLDVKIYNSVVNNTPIFKEKNAD